jgi:2-dehydro-3-deoxyglucarate aldolase/4-hydroxy-2-oxoheptanedioate aldolase
MRENTVKSKIQSGQVSLGTFIFEFRTDGIGRLAANAGAEFLIFDMEHTGWSVETIRTLIATTRSTSAIPCVRIPATDYHFVARVLDMGALGIMAPMVESEEQARRMVESAKYPPVGRRGSAFTIAHDDFAGGDIDEKIRTANEQSLLIAQIETAKGLERVDEITAVPGIDVLWIGQYDLSNSLGIPGRFDHPLFVDAVNRVLASCRRFGKTPGFMPLDLDTGRRFIDLGFKMLAYGGDLWLYQAALRKGLGELRTHLERSNAIGGAVGEG